MNYKKPVPYNSIKIFYNNFNVDNLFIRSISIFEIDLKISDIQLASLYLIRLNKRFIFRKCFLLKALMSSLKII